MKFVLLAMAILAIWPIALALRAQPAVRPFFWGFIGLLPFVSTYLRTQVAFVSWSGQWQGHSFGLEVALFDILMISAYLSMPRIQTSYSHVPFILYFAAVAQSLVNAEHPIAASFYLAELIRIYFAIFVISKAATEIYVVFSVMRGLALGLAIQAVFVTYQRFIQNVIQPPGTFTHQNVLGLSAHFVIYPHFAMLIAGRSGLAHIVAPVAGAWIAALTASRGAIGFSALGFGLTYVSTAFGRWTMRKTLVTSAGLIGVLALAPVVIGAFVRRLSLNPLQENIYDEREAFNRAALAILDQFPFGVGANHYVFVAKNYGYALRAGVYPEENNLSTLVHNAYLLVASQTGYVGLVTFLIMLAYPLTLAFLFGIRERRRIEGLLLIGLGVSLFVVYVHSLFEWVIFSIEVQYLFAIAFGLIFGTVHRIRCSSSVLPKRAG